MKCAYCGREIEERHEILTYDGDFVHDYCLSDYIEDGEIAKIIKERFEEDDGVRYTIEDVLDLAKSLISGPDSTSDILYGKEFKVIKEFDSIFKRIGTSEEFYAFEKNGNLEYGILDRLFGQPSAANWVENSYSDCIRKRASYILQEMIDNGHIKIIEE